MKWIGNRPPLYVWEGDEWVCEMNGITYEANIGMREWIQGDNIIPFPPKVRIMKHAPREYLTRTVSESTA